MVRFPASLATRQNDYSWSNINVSLSPEKDMKSFAHEMQLTNYRCTQTIEIVSTQRGCYELLRGASKVPLLYPGGDSLDVSLHVLHVAALQLEDDVLFVGRLGLLEDGLEDLTLDVVLQFLATVASVTARGLSVTSEVRNFKGRGVEGLFIYSSCILTYAGSLKGGEGRKGGRKNENWSFL